MNTQIKNYLFIPLFLCLLLLNLLVLAHTLDAGPLIDPEDAAQYLESGDFSYNIDVNFSRIAKKSPRYYAEKQKEISSWVKEDPNDPKRVITYLDFLIEAGFNHEAAELADRYLGPFRDLYQQTNAALPALWYMKTANAAGEKKDLDEAYEGVRPFLESGKAPLDMVLTAMENRERSNSYQLAMKLAGFYFTVYPEEPELFFRTFLISMGKSLYETVPAFLEQASQLLPQNSEGGQEKQEEQKEEHQLKTYFHTVLSQAKENIHLDILDRAVALDEDNYQYRLTSAGFRTLVRWFSQISTLSRVSTPEIGLKEIRNSFSKAAPEMTERIKTDLKKALSLRPSYDVEIYLAAALAEASFGNTDKTLSYAEKALETRPDNPRCYDALLFAYLYRHIHREDPLEAAQEDLKDVLARKSQAGLASAYDYFSLAALTMMGLSDAGNNEWKERLAVMERYAEASLDRREEWYGYLALGNALLLKGNTSSALRLYRHAESIGGDKALPLVKTNIGILYAVEGKKDLAVASLSEALGISKLDRETETIGEGSRARRALKHITRE